MKTWQILLVGMIGAIALFSFHAYESALAGVVALGMLAAVAFGFCVRPRKEVFYVRTTVHVPDPDYLAVVEHDRIAVRVEMTRLWLLFVATFTAVAFLLVTFAAGTTWKISLFDASWADWLNLGPYPILLFFRFFVIAVFGLLTAWVSERWVLWDASLCSASFLHRYRKRIMYSFEDPSGEYYGGEGLPLGATQSPKLRTIVLYRTSKPHLNKIAMCCVFHRLRVLGHGVTDLDEATVAAKSLEAVSSPL